MPNGEENFIESLQYSNMVCLMLMERNIIMYSKIKQKVLC